VVGLAPAGVGRSLPAECAPLLRGGVAAFAGPELGKLGLERSVDLRGALGELLEEFVGDAGDLGLPVHDLTPRDAVTGGQLGAQHRLIDPTQRPLVALQGACVEGEPAPLVGLHLR
jgi:hypothetical protein